MLGSGAQHTLLLQRFIADCAMSKETVANNGRPRTPPPTSRHRCVVVVPGRYWAGWLADLEPLAILLLSVLCFFVFAPPIQHFTLCALLARATITLAPPPSQPLFSRVSRG